MPLHMYAREQGKHEWIDLGLAEEREIVIACKGDNDAALRLLRSVNPKVEFVFCESQLFREKMMSEQTYDRTSQICFILAVLSAFGCVAFPSIKIIFIILGIIAGARATSLYFSWHFKYCHCFRH